MIAAVDPREVEAKGALASAIEAGGKAGVAKPAISSARPRSSSNSSVRTCTPTALDVVAGADCLSMMRTGMPRRDSSSAAVSPVGPAPTINTRSGIGVSYMKVSGPPSGAFLLPLPATPQARAVPARPKSVASHRKGGIERDLWIGWVEPICGEDWKCRVGSAAGPVQLPAGRHYYGGRELTMKERGITHSAEGFHGGRRAKRNGGR